MIKIRGNKRRVKSPESITRKRTNIFINAALIRRISSHTRLKSRRAIVDFALQTTAELLEKKEKIAKASKSVFGMTKGTEVYPKNYARDIRGK